MRWASHSSTTVLVDLGVVGRGHDVPGLVEVLVLQRRSPHVTSPNRPRSSIAGVTSGDTTTARLRRRSGSAAAGRRCRHDDQACARRGEACRVRGKSFTALLTIVLPPPPRGFFPLFGLCSVDMSLDRPVSPDPYDLSPPGAVLHGHQRGRPPTGGRSRTTRSTPTETPRRSCPGATSPRRPRASRSPASTRTRRRRPASGTGCWWTFRPV